MRPKNRPIPLLLVLFVLGSNPARSSETGTDPPEPPSPETITKSIEAYLEPAVAAGHVSGSVLVALEDDILFERAYGLANHEHRVANRLDTPHCIASISKVMTLAMGIRLAEQGKLTPGATIDRWLPGFPRSDRITVEHLMRHRAGIPHRVTAEDDEDRPRDASMMVALAAEVLRDDDRFLCEPGAVSHYSSAGYSVLARVLELASGKSYDDLLQELICTPAKMTSTVHLDGRTLLPGRAQSYMPVATGVRNAPLKDLSFLVGAGSVYSTARDLFLFLAGIRDGAYGASVKASLFDRSGKRTNGATNGFRAFADYHAKTGVTVVVTANLTTGALDRMRADLPRIAAGEEVPPLEPPRVSSVAMQPETLNRYEGVYEMRPGSRLNARLEGGDFLVGSYVLVPTGADRFFSFQDYAEVTGKLDGKGDVQALDWNGFLMRKVVRP